MASSQKGKKAVKQEDLRRLMREKQRDSERQKRVESPFARYSGGGLLTCALCDVPVKSALLWQTHVLGKQHKDKVQELKTKQSSSTTAAPSSSSSSSVLKRPAEPQPEPAPGKRAKLQTTAAGVSAGRPELKVVSAGLGLLAGHYDDDDDDEDDDDEDKGRNPPSTDSALPADFFDSGTTSAPPAVSHSGSVSKAGDDEEEAAAQEKKEKDQSSEALPEGFFDDPVRDAKVRNVDTPKDQMDREWEEFQKEMRQVNSASDAIVAEDDEEGRLERQIDEIDEQIQCLRRVEKLRARQEIVKRRMRRRRQQMKEMQMMEEEEEDEEELMHVLTQDWRAKGALA